MELGASPNYRDAKGLTSVYLSVAKKTDPKISEALLHDHAVLGTQDTQGWHEVHQVRRYSLTSFVLFCFVHLGYGIAFCSIYIFCFLISYHKFLFLLFYILKRLSDGDWIYLVFIIIILVCVVLLL